jgi:hypothetical protein
MQTSRPSLNRRELLKSTSAALTTALKAGADGVIFSRKYSEMRLPNLAAGGKAVQDFSI